MQAEQARWVKMLDDQWADFISNKAWRPPWTLNGDWHPPSGVVFSFVEKIQITQAIAERCVAALSTTSCCGPIAVPTTGAVKSYLDKLLKRNLHMYACGQRMKEPRNAWVYMEAAHIIKTMSDKLGFVADAVIEPASRGAEASSRWILKQDLAELKSETRKLKRSLDETVVGERLALARAEKAEEHAAIARSQHDVASMRATELQDQVDARQARASSEVMNLRREVQNFKTNEKLLQARVLRAEKEAAVARSMLDLANQHAKEALEQVESTVRRMDEQQAELTQLMLEKEELRARASRSYTVELSEQLKEQQQVLDHSTWIASFSLLDSLRCSHY